LGTVTLGTPSDEQIIDGLAEEYKKSYFLHYNFPPFSVGEAGFMRAPGRRELGHGALAERALLPMIPSKDDFPYTIRVVSDILESNGSSSMATVCSGTMAMLAAGVPLKKPVAGIANGLIMDGDEFEVLTDIQGMEDHLGDMDFKVTGTRDGITAMQMDIKIEGITREIMEIALEKALAARLYILDKIEACIPEKRDDLCKYAPRIESMKVKVDQIALVIGPGGKNIKKITELSKADISIEEDGTVKIASPDGESIAIARKMIYELTHEPEVGEIFDGEVVRIEPYGAFVKYIGGKQGLVHVSQMSKFRLNHPEELVKMNQKIKVKFTGLKEGKAQLSMKGVEGNPELEEAPERKPRPERDNKSKDGHRRDSRDRRGNNRHHSNNHKKN
jgi:polyribonucleotide nucleotidyltransferase